MTPRGAAPLVGRNADVAALSAAADEARAGEARAVVVAGEPGIGKSRLVSEVVDALDDALVLTGHAADMSTGEIPFGVLADTLRDLRHREGKESLTPAERSTLAPLLPDTASEVVDPARILAAALDLLARLCTDRLLVWVVEDLHWADSPSRDLLNLAVRTLRGHLLVIVTARPDDPSTSPTGTGLAEQVAALSSLAHVRRLDLSRMTDAEVLSLAQSLDDHLPPHVLRSIVRLSDGVPFVVEEMAAAHGRLPATSLLAALTARVARLSVQARRLVEATAIGEGHLRISLVEQVLDPADGTLDPALAEAVTEGVLTCDYSRDQLGFRHALLREAVDQDIGPVARRDWHRRWAEVLEQNPGVLAADPVTLALAEHWHRAGEATRSVSAAFAALPAVRRTADDEYRLELWRRIFDGWDQRDRSSPVGRLTRREAIGEALRRAIVSDDALLPFLRTVEGLPLQPEERLLVGAFRSLLGRPKVGSPDFETVLRAAKEVDWLAEPVDELTKTALAALGLFLPLDDSERADAFLARVESLAKSDGDRDLLLDLAKVRSNRATEAGELTEAIRVLEQTLAQLDPDDVSRRLSAVGDLTGVYTLVGRHQAADVLATVELETTRHLETRAEMWEHVVENAMFTWMCTGQWAKPARLWKRRPCGGPTRSG